MAMINRGKMTDIVDEDLTPAAGWRRDSVATTTTTTTECAAIATSRRSTFIASTS